MRFGLSRMKITPGFPTCLACSQQKDTLFERIHDDVFIRCMVLCDDNECLLIVSYDLLFHSRDLHGLIHDAVSNEYGLRPENILVGFTHNHNSPSTLGYNDQSASPEYEDFLRKTTVDAINNAFGSMESGYLEYGEIPGVWAVNRRKPSDSGVMLAPNPGGRTDDMIYLLRLVSDKGRTKGLLVNYACHPVHYPDTLCLTSEYPGFLCSYLESNIEGCIPVFLQGAGADARPASTVQGDRFVHRSFEYIDRMASKMGKAVVFALDGRRLRKVDPCFCGKSFRLRIPVDDEGREYFAACARDAGLSGHLRRNAAAMTEAYDSLDDFFMLECGIMRLGTGLFLAHMGGEPCCEVKFNISDIFRKYNLIFSGYTDGSAYIVTDKMLDEGGYEVDCFLEYMHKGRIKHGIDSIIRKGYEDAFLQIQGFREPT